MFSTVKHVSHVDCKSSWRSNRSSVREMILRRLCWSRSLSMPYTRLSVIVLSIDIDCCNDETSQKTNRETRERESDLIVHLSSNNMENKGKCRWVGVRTLVTYWCIYFLLDGKHHYLKTFPSHVNITCTHTQHGKLSTPNVHFILTIKYWSINPNDSVIVPFSHTHFDLGSCLRRMSSSQTPSNSSFWIRCIETNAIRSSLFIC